MRLYATLVKGVTQICKLPSTRMRAKKISWLCGWDFDIGKLDVCYSYVSITEKMELVYFTNTILLLD
jgi:hypothetical protein